MQFKSVMQANAVNAGPKPLRFLECRDGHHKLSSCQQPLRPKQSENCSTFKVVQKALDSDVD